MCASAHGGSKAGRRSRSHRAHLCLRCRSSSDLLLQSCSCCGGSRGGSGRRSAAGVWAGRSSIHRAHIGGTLARRRHHGAALGQIDEGALHLELRASGSGVVRWGHDGDGRTERGTAGRVAGDGEGEAGASGIGAGRARRGAGTADSSSSGELPKRGAFWSERRADACEKADARESRQSIVLFRFLLGSGRHTF